MEIKKTTENPLQVGGKKPFRQERQGSPTSQGWILLWFGQGRVQAGHRRKDRPLLYCFFLGSEEVWGCDKLILTGERLEISHKARVGRLLALKWAVSQRIWHGPMRTPGGA